MAKYIGRRIVPTHGGVWSKDKTYEELTIVFDKGSKNSFISRIPVPAGTVITNETYWMLYSVYSAQIAEAVQQMKGTETSLTAHVNTTEQSMRSRVEKAEELSNQNKTTLNARMDTMDARLDANVKASTDSSSDYAAEIVDARVDSEGKTLESLGKHLRSISSGLLPKLRPMEVCPVSSEGSKATISVDGLVCDCTFHHVAGYVGVFVNFFGSSFDEIKRKKYRIVMRSDNTPLNGEALITNYGSAWGNEEGTVGSASLGGLSLSEKNSYTTFIDIDFSESRWAEYVKKYKASKLFFCFRREHISALDARFWLYAYELTDWKDFNWKYVSEAEQLRLLEKEIKDARGEKESLDERIKFMDSIVSLKLPYVYVIGPSDNTNGQLSKGTMGGRVVERNVIIEFDREAYDSEYEKTYWSSLHFVFCIAADTLKSLKSMDSLYLNTKFEGIGTEGNAGHDGETSEMWLYLNNVGGWGTTVNEPVPVPLMIGSETIYHLDKTMIQRVLDTGSAIYAVFNGTFLSSKTVAEMKQVRLTMSVMNRNVDTELNAFMTRVDIAKAADNATESMNAVHAEQSDKAELADYAGSAGNAVVADNFFQISADELLNVEGKRYSKGLDTLEYPKTYPYSYQCGLQSTENRANVQTKGTGFDQYVDFNIRLSKNSSQPSNQGYVKLLQGMMSIADFIGKFSEGYKCCYVCEIEEFENLPQGANSGIYENTLLFGYTDEEDKFNVPINTTPVLSRVIQGKRKMWVWKVAFKTEDFVRVKKLYATGNLHIDWFGIWNTASYKGDVDAVWNPKWYWQDYAFTDDSYSADDMATFFQRKYTYWCSYVNHARLKEKFTQINSAIEELKTGNRSNISGIVCWGDSLTAGAGWTGTLQSLSGIPVYNGGTGGENARTIMARQGADVMMVNNITIPGECEPVTVAKRNADSGIKTAEGYKVTPLLQGGAHVNPVMIAGVEGVLRWTGSSYADMNGIWTFTRNAVGDAVKIERPTAIRTDFDRNHNKQSELMVLFIGQNGGYADMDDLVRMHRLMIDHFKGKEYIILGLSSGTKAQRTDYESRMKKEFGRRFISLREYLAEPIYDADGQTVINCYGLSDAGIEPTETDIEQIKLGQVPQTLLADSVHYTAATKTVIGTMLYKKMVELGILEG